MLAGTTAQHESDEGGERRKGVAGAGAEAGTTARHETEEGGGRRTGCASQGG